jgi:toxin ParE1/3/4
VRIRWSPRAQRQLLELGEHIARDDPDTAARWVAKLQDRVDGLAQMPLTGRSVPEIPRGNVREVIVGNYRVVYRVGKRVLEVLAVLEGHMRLSRALD